MPPPDMPLPDVPDVPLPVVPDVPLPVVPDVPLPDVPLPDVPLPDVPDVPLPLVEPPLPIEPCDIVALFNMNLPPVPSLTHPVTVIVSDLPRLPDCLPVSCANATVQQASTK